MDYAQSHLLEWLSQRPCLSLQCLENEIGMPSGTLRHFLKQRRNLPKVHFGALCDKLEHYGFMQLNDE